MQKVTERKGKEQMKKQLKKKERMNKKEYVYTKLILFVCY